MDSLKQKTISLLRWSERYTKTDMVYLFKNSSWLILQQVSIVVSAFILSVLFAHYVSQETFGEYRFVLSVAGILSLSTLLGVVIASTRSIARGKDLTMAWLSFKQIQWGLIGFVASFAVASYYFLQGNFVLASAFVVVAPAIPFMDTFLGYDYFLRGKHDFKTTAIYRTISQVSIVALLGITVVLFPLTTVMLVALYFFLYTVSRAFFYNKTIGLGNIVAARNHVPTQDDQEALSYSKNLSVTLSFGLIANMLDKIIIFHFLGAVPLAIYAFATIMPEQVKGLAKHVVSVGLPKLSDQDHSEAYGKLYIKVGLPLIIASIIVAFYVLIIGFIFSIFFSPYLESVPFTKVFALTIIPAIGIYVLRTLLFSQQATRSIYILSIVQATTQIIGVIIGVIYFDILGIIIGIITAQTVGFVIALLLVLYERKEYTKQEGSYT